jgi:hypothetical protein
MGIILKPKVEKSILYFGEFGSSKTDIVRKIHDKIKGQLVFEAKNNVELLEIVKMVNIDLLLIDSRNLLDYTIEDQRKVFDLRKDIKLLLFNSEEMKLGLLLVEENRETIISQFYNEKIMFRALSKIIFKENYNWS